MFIALLCKIWVFHKNSKDKIYVLNVNTEPTDAVWKTTFLQVVILSSMWEHIQKWGGGGGVLGHLYWTLFKLLPQLNFQLTIFPLLSEKFLSNFSIF